MAKATFVKAARNDIPEIGVKAGESYYWWKFKNGPKMKSKTAPRRSQLTQSAFLSQLYDIEDQLDEATADETIGDVRDGIVSDLGSLRDECQEKLDNMPEGLQQGPTGELLQERIDNLESWIGELENVDCDAPSDDDDAEDDEDEEARAERLQAHWDEKKQEMIDSNPGIG